MSSNLDFIVRAAGPQDNAALIALERRSPLLVGDVELAFDRAPDYFATARLQERTRLAVAEHAGRLVGVCANALHRTRLLGRERLLAYTHHERIDPDFQRHGVGRALPRWLQQRRREEGFEPDRGYAFIDAMNASSLAFSAAGDGPGPWPLDAWLQELPADAAAQGSRLEPVDAAEADRVIALLNATHAGLELFPGYTRERLLRRLARAPDYGWPQWLGLRGAGRLVAVAGVYDQGAHVAAHLRLRASGEVHESRALVLLDYGYVPGEDAPMLELLGALQSVAAARGRQVLELSVPEQRPLFQPVMDRAASHIRFKFLGGAPLPGPGDHLQGIYIDPVYL